MPRPNVLIIGDTHEPFCHPDYLDFCRDTAKKFKCTDIYHIGDEVDNHAISFHDHDPDGDSPEGEFQKAVNKLKRWYKAFPNVKVCVGNHSALPFRQAYTSGLPKRFLKTYEEVWEAPKGWQWNLEYVTACGALIEHGTGASGKNAAIKRAEQHRMNTVIGHCHTEFGVKFSVSRKDIIYGMSVGCGIDRQAYAFAYAKENAAKPILGCGVIVEGIPMSVPMSL
jgi:hypothetical protein